MVYIANIHNWKIGRFSESFNGVSEINLRTAYFQLDDFAGFVEFVLCGKAA